MKLPKLPFALIFTEQYNRRAARFLKQHTELRQTYLKTLQLLEANPMHPSLRLHALRGKFKGLHSVSINLSYRIMKWTRNLGQVFKWDTVERNG